MSSVNIIRLGFVYVMAESFELYSVQVQFWK